MGDWNLGVIADRLQEAALDPTLWRNVLTDLSRQVGAAGALLMSQDSHFPGPPASPELDFLLEDYFQNEWYLRDERFRGIPTLLRKGVIVDQDCVPPEEMCRSGYYQDFIARHDLPGFVAVGFRAEKDLWCVTLARSTAQGPFEPDEIKRLSTLWRPLRDAATLSRQLGFARVLGIADALELTCRPGVLLDARCRVLALNNLAEALVGDMMDIARQTLLFRDPQSQASFEALFESAIDSHLLEGPAPLSAMVRNSTGQRMTIYAVALRGWARFTFTNARVLLLFGTPPVPSDCASLLRAAFGLTPSEARLAAELSSGISVAQGAEKLRITYQTARSLLKSIYFKTDTHRQGQLIALIARMQKGA